MELLGHLLLKRRRDEERYEKEVNDRWLDFLSRMHSHPMMAEPNAEQKRAREDFIDMIIPKNKNAESAKPYEWDFDTLEQFRAKGG